MTRALILAIVASFAATPLWADDLYKPGGWSTLAADRKATRVGDVLTVMVFQVAESTSSARSDSGKNTSLSGGLSVGPVNESGNLRVGGNYTGGGQVQRSERFVTQITVVVESVWPNGDLQVGGRQKMQVNGETSNIGVRGRVRQADIAADNSVRSSRLADAQIDYDGRGFVSRSAKPGLVNRVFRFLGLG